MTNVIFGLIVKYFQMKNMISTHKIFFYEKSGHNQLDFEEKVTKLIQHILACPTKI